MSDWLDEPEELWEARMRDQDMSPQEDEGDYREDEMDPADDEPEWDGYTYEWEDEPDRRLY